MDKQDSWKKTDGIETDLADFLRSLCRQWKRIVLCALAAAAVLGGYGWMKAGRDLPDVSVTEGEPGIEEDTGTEADQEEAEMTAAQEQAVADAVRLEKEIGDMETYMDRSVLMQTDPYHRPKYTMLYCIDRTGLQELPKITESYLNFLLNGGAADELLEAADSWKMDKSCYSELVSAYQKTFSYPWQTTAGSEGEGGVQPQALFCVEITGRDAGETEKMALDMQKVLKRFSEEEGAAQGSHRLTLVSSAQSVKADSDLLALQRDRKNGLSSNKMSLITAVDAFSEEQMALYKKSGGSLEGTGQKNGAGESASGEEGSEGAASGEDTSGEAVSGTVSRSSAVKYVFLGFIGGIFVYCCGFSCWYIFCDTVKSAEEMKRTYTFPVYGSLQPEDGEHRAAVPAQQDTYGHTRAQVFSRIRLSCQKRGVEKLCAASDFPLSQAERKCLESMAGQLKGWEIEMKVAEDISTDTAVWDGLSENGYVLMICRMGTTTHRMIDDAMNFYQENDVAVIGAAVFLQNS